MKVLVRAVVLLVLAAAVGFGLSRLSDPNGGADIGAGLLAFVVLIVVSFVWALVDAARAKALLRIVVRWVVVAVLVELGLAVFPQVGSSEFFSPRAYVDDLLTSGLLGLGLVLVPAVVGALIGRLVGGRRRVEEQPPPPPAAA